MRLFTLISILSLSTCCLSSCFSSLFNRSFFPVLPEGVYVLSSFEGESIYGYIEIAEIKEEEYTQKKGKGVYIDPHISTKEDAYRSISLCWSLDLGYKEVDVSVEQESSSIPSFYVPKGDGSRAEIIFEDGYPQGYYSAPSLGATYQMEVYIYNEIKEDFYFYSLTYERENTYEE